MTRCRRPASTDEHWDNPRRIHSLVFGFLKLEYHWTRLLSRLLRMRGIIGVRDAYSRVAPFWLWPMRSKAPVAVPEPNICPRTPGLLCHDISLPLINISPLPHCWKYLDPGKRAGSIYRLLCATWESEGQLSRWFDWNRRKWGTLKIA